MTSTSNDFSASVDLPSDHDTVLDIVVDPVDLPAAAPVRDFIAAAVVTEIAGPIPAVIGRVDPVETIEAIEPAVTYATLAAPRSRIVVDVESIPHIVEFKNISVVAELIDGMPAITIRVNGDPGPGLTVLNTGSRFVVEV